MKKGRIIADRQYVSPVANTAIESDERQEVLSDYFRRLDNLHGQFISYHNAVISGLNHCESVLKSVTTEFYKEVLDDITTDPTLHTDPLIETWHSTSRRARKDIENGLSEMRLAIRVSTEEQAAHGISLDAQRAKIEAYALTKDLELVGIIEDAGKSAKDLRRPGMQEVLAMNAGQHTDIDRLFLRKRGLPHFN